MHSRNFIKYIWFSLPLLFIIFVVGPRYTNAVTDSLRIPEDFSLQMKRMVGSWVFSGNEGDRKFTGHESIRIINNGSALLQEGYFDLGGGEKQHYVILSGWDAEKKALVVNGFTSDGYAFNGKWKSVSGSSFVGTANGRPAKFTVGKEAMRYEEDGGKWVSSFERSDEK